MTKETLERKLRELGNNSRSVRKSLRDLGIRGARDHAECCPLANFLVSLRGVTNAEVRGRGEIMVWQKGVPYIEFLEGPPWLPTFLKNFDEGKYPDLDEAEDG